MEKLISLSKDNLIVKLWNDASDIMDILSQADSLSEAQGMIFRYLNGLEDEYFKTNSEHALNQLHILEKNNAKECIRVLKNFFRSENEKLTGFSALSLLIGLAKKDENACKKAGKGFLCEIIFLINGAKGKAIKELVRSRQLDNIEGKKAASIRSKTLDSYSLEMIEAFKRFKNGYDKDIIKQRNSLKKDIIKFFNASHEDWNDYKWHLKHVISDMETLSALVKLEDDEMRGLKAARENNIVFQITPYYLSLFNKSGRCEYDRAIRALVLPSKTYCANVAYNRQKGINMDFMDERSTSPIDTITRRYAQILILKPFDSCPQICVYCQRNWEIKGLDEAEITKEKLNAALNWIENNLYITEVLVTGGDPLTLSNENLEWIIDRISKMNHIERIRIGTRTLVTLPYRINEGFLKLLKKYHQWGKREICIMTHYSHPSELTPDSLTAVKKIKRLGINIYNQQVFTYYNSRRFETCYLRRALKVSGIDPYYAFNTKGKEETVDFRVPIARIEQERHEEARLLPGVVRTDEAVFNVPRLGKSHLRAWQHHEPIMLLDNGKRVYRFYPWESRIAFADDYIYTDVSIYDYLKRLRADGENVRQYNSIWYYF